ncbi:MAG TPA: acylphosphatase [Chthoniobacterales bacterium]|jgi:acylphosphatase
MTSVQVFYEGRVQGVGFRYSVKQIAKGFSITGWIRNLQDGRVEMQASGEAEELDAFLQTVQKSELRPLIRKVSKLDLATAPVSQGFEIRHE